MKKKNESLEDEIVAIKNEIVGLKKKIDDLEGELKDASTPEDKGLLIRQQITANTNRLTGLEADLRKLREEGELIIAGCSCSFLNVIQSICLFFLLFCYIFSFASPS